MTDSGCDSFSDDEDGEDGIEEDMFVEDAEGTEDEEGPDDNDDREVLSTVVTFPGYHAGKNYPYRTVVLDSPALPKLPLQPTESRISKRSGVRMPRLTIRDRIKRIFPFSKKSDK